MNKKIILSLASALVLSTTLFASGMNGNCKEGMKKECSQKMCNKMDKKHHGKSRMISMIMQLDLSDEQRSKIKELMQENRKNMPKTSDAFSESSFDKERYIKLSKEKRDNKIQNRANMIERIYGVLTPAQKKEFKEMLNQKRAMRNTTR